MEAVNVAPDETDLVQFEEGGGNNVSGSLLLHCMLEAV